MIKIKYPFSGKKPLVTKKKFNQQYYDLVKIKVDETKINLLLSKINTVGNNSITLQKLITADFTKLLEYKTLIEKHPVLKNLNKCFIATGKKPENIYGKTQGAISSFFMENGFDMKTCHYCNIDFINIFEERFRFRSLEHFINEAPKEVLTLMDGISEETAKKIRASRFGPDLDKVLKKVLSPGIYIRIKSFLNDDVANKLTSFNYKDIIILKNHFTLDHFLPKNEFPYFGLSLYNLVPSCNSCNCKFKGAMEFISPAKLSWLSPTSTTFKLDNNLEFKLYFKVAGLNLNEKVNNVNTLNDFEIVIEDKKSIDGFDTYLDMFKLRGRYEFHRNDALKMIKKRSEYPDSQIDEFSELFINKGLNKDKTSVKVDLFGSSIFNPEEINEPFAKYKKDIAEQLGLLK